MLDSGSQENSQTNTDPVFQDRVNEAIDHALRLSDEERAEYLKTLCRDEPDVVAEVISLLQFESIAEQIDELPSLNPDWLTPGNLSSLLQFSVEIDGFRIIREIGQGANSVVYEAEQLDPHRQVAIKVLSLTSGAADAADRFKLEGHIGARLEHPLIARVYQTGVARSGVLERPYIAMEYVRGVPLTSVIHDPKLGFEVRRSVLHSIFHATQYAHEQGVIHRDIKPSNVIVEIDSDSSKLIRVKVVDFGIAKLVDDTSIPVSIRTLDAQLLGTLRYMSPERISGQCNGGNVASDIYSLGVLAEELLSGGRANSNDSEVKKTERAGLSEHVRHVLQRMIADKPTDRYSSVLDAQKALDAAFDNTRFVSHIRSYQRRVKASANRFFLKHRRLVVLIALLASVAACGTGWMTIQLVKSNRLALEQTTEEFNATRELESVWRHVNAQVQLANAYIDSGEFDEARQVYQQLIERIGPIDQLDQRVQHAILINQAYLAQKARNIEEARQYYLQIRKEIDQLHAHDHTNIWFTWISTAHGLQNCKEPEIAREMYEYVLSIPEFQDLPWRIRTHGLACYGGFLWTQGEYESAQELLYESFQDPPEHMSLKARTDFAHRHSSYGLILDTMKQHEEATSYHVAARELLTVLNGPMDVMVYRAILNEATNALYLGEIDRGRSLAQQSKAFFQTSPKAWAPELIESDILISASAMLNGKADEALLQLESVFEFGAEYSVPTYRWDVYATPLLAAALVVTGDQPERLDDIFAKCAEIKERLGPTHPWFELLEPYFVQAEDEWVALWAD